MINFKELSFKNFMSYGSQPTVLKMDDDLTTLVLGNNEDVGAQGESANGVGKTVLIQALTFALYGKGVDKMKTDEFINLRNGKKLEVVLSFEKDGVEYRVRRGRKPNFLKLEADGEDLTRDSMKNTEEDIAKILDVPYEIFIRSIFMSPHIDSFLSMTPAEQRNYIEEVLSLDVLANRAEALKKVMKREVSDEIKLLDRDIDKANASNIKVQDSISSTEEKIQRFDQEQQQTVSRLKDELSAIPAVTEDTLDSLNIVENYKKQQESAQENVSDYKEAKTKKEAELARLGDVVDRYADLVEKEEGHSGKVLKKKKKIEQEISELPTMDTINAHKAIAKLVDERQETNASLSTELEVAVQRDRDMTRENSAFYREMTSLESGVCPFCSQEHFDREKLSSMEEEWEKRKERSMSLAIEVDRVDSELQTKWREFTQAIEELQALADPLPEEFTDNPDGCETHLKRLQERLEEIEASIEDNPYTPMVKELLEENGGSEEKMIERLDSLEEELKGIDSELGRNKQLVLDFQDAIDSLTESLGFKSKVEAEMLNDKRKSLSARISEEESKENPYIGMIDEYRDMLVDVTSLEEQKAESEKVLTHINYMIKLLTDPKSFIRKNIVDRYIPFVNKKMNEYAGGLGLSHVIEIKSDMTVDIEYMGKSVSYFMMSRGERLRANVAASMAFRDLMAMLGRSANFLFVDELLDGSADSYGMQAIFDLIASQSNSVFIVSHREEFKDSVDRHMVVTKRNGFSEIELGDCS